MKGTCFNIYREQSHPTAIDVREHFRPTTPSPKPESREWKDPAAQCWDQREKASGIGMLRRAARWIHRDRTQANRLIGVLDGHSLTCLTYWTWIWGSKHASTAVAKAGGKRATKALLPTPASPVRYRLKGRVGEKWARTLVAPEGGREGIYMRNYQGGRERREGGPRTIDTTASSPLPRKPHLFPPVKMQQKRKGRA